MSKYYKAEDVIAFLNLHCPKDMWEYQIADLPTIDIVRCEECKYWQKSREYSVMCCMRERPNRPIKREWRGDSWYCISNCPNCGAKMKG